MSTNIVAPLCVADMPVNPAWTGTITQVRVDFGSSPRGHVDVDWIGFDE